MPKVKKSLKEGYEYVPGYVRRKRGYRKGSDEGLGVLILIFTFCVCAWVLYEFLRRYWVWLVVALAIVGAIGLAIFLLWIWWRRRDWVAEDEREPAPENPTLRRALEDRTLALAHETQIRSEWLGRKTNIKECEKQHLVVDGRLGPHPIPFGFKHQEWLDFKRQLRRGDELRQFRSPPQTWSHLCGREGICIVRDGEIIAEIVTRRN